jgi:hypothetical protein
MDEQAIRELAAEVERGRLPRRRFLQTMVAAGLTVPMAASLLTAPGVSTRSRGRRARRPHVAAAEARYGCSTGRPPRC